MFAGYSDSVLDDDIWLEHGSWLNTGDIARVDQDGYVWIVGRAKDVIIRGGHNIDPKAVEEILYRHPDVVEAVVVGRPDAHAGEVPVAYVQLKSGASASTQDILEFVAAHVHERAAIPKSCCIAQEIPKSPMGKILRQPLRRSALEDGIRLILNKAGIAGGFRAEAMDGPAGSLKARVYLESSDIDEALARRALSGLSLEIDILRT
jgi:fatty-acyl-CoA synthase/long-chain acyl-CoA synthetase